MNDDLFDAPYYPDRPGYVRGSDTSAEAADSIDPNMLSRLRRLVYEHVRKCRDGSTCDEVEAALTMRHQTASARLREPELTGFLQTSDEKRPTRTGRSAHVYRVAVRGAA